VNFLLERRGKTKDSDSNNGTVAGGDGSQVLGTPINMFSCKLIELGASSWSARQMLLKAASRMVTTAKVVQAGVGIFLGSQNPTRIPELLVSLQSSQKIVFFSHILWVLPRE